jgi:signal peptidase complex subunit 3
MTDFSANRKKTDLGVLQLNMDISEWLLILGRIWFLWKLLDLNPLFDWNVKQLFLYLIAEYVTPANVSTSFI